MRQAFHVATVTCRRFLTPGMVRLTFGGVGLSSFQSTGIGDEYIRLFFPDPDTGELALPHIDAEGRWTLPEKGPQVRYATYTVRRFDAAACELDVDFVIHAGGLASGWAQAAEPGDKIIINNPRGLYQPPPALSWQILLADATGLPALARLLEQTPEHVASRVVVEVADAAHAQDLPPHPRAVVTWVHGTGNGLCASSLDTLLPEIPLPAGPGYLWAAGEQTMARNLRRMARKMAALGTHHCKAIAYWIGEAKAASLDSGVIDAVLREKLQSRWSI
jgi:NADPH-dependent ferric siderophore reductase